MNSIEIPFSGIDTESLNDLEPTFADLANLARHPDRSDGVRAFFRYFAAACHAEAGRRERTSGGAVTPLDTDMLTDADVGVLLSTFAHLKVARSAEGDSELGDFFGLMAAEFSRLRNHRRDVARVLRRSLLPRMELSWAPVPESERETFSCIIVVEVMP